jgi:hypothetical protein
MARRSVAGRQAGLFQSFGWIWTIRQNTSRNQQWNPGWAPENHHHECLRFQMDATALACIGLGMGWHCDKKVHRLGTGRGRYEPFASRIEQGLSQPAEHVKRPFLMSMQARSGIGRDQHRFLAGGFPMEPGAPFRCSDAHRRSTGPMEGQETNVDLCFEHYHSSAQCTGGQRRDPQ